MVSDILNSGQVSMLQTQSLLSYRQKNTTHFSVTRIKVLFDTTTITSLSSSLCYHHQHHLVIVTIFVIIITIIGLSLSSLVTSWLPLSQPSRCISEFVPYCNIILTTGIISFNANADESEDAGNGAYVKLTDYTDWIVKKIRENK